MRPVASFAITCTHILRGDGSTEGEMPDSPRTGTWLVPLYRAMVLTRPSTPRRSRCSAPAGSAPSPPRSARRRSRSASAAAMRPEDVLLPSYREHGAQLWRGVTHRRAAAATGAATSAAATSRGRATISRSACRSPANACMRPASPMPSSCAASRGWRSACSATARPRRATSTRRINLAGVWRLPVVFVVNNNQWAISVPRAAQTAAETLAQKAIAAGFPGEQVDGNDVIAVRDAVEQALGARPRGRRAER